MFSDAFVFVLFLVDTGVSMVKNCCVGVKRSAIGSDEFVEKILDQSQTFVILSIFPEDLDLKNAHKALQLESFSDSGDKIFAHFNFFSEILVILLRLLDGGGHLEAQAFIESVEVMALDDVPILFDVFGDPGDGPGLLVIDGFVEQGESVLYFWLNIAVPRRRVWTWFYSLAGGASSLLFCSLLSFSMSILKNI